ncbi:heparan-alpha-glucosaminide N-acetyltransferase domain-containing protein [Formosa sp. S-31]|uniref:heparan-alpha-glucosaminide N-acetyltransferase domain-containing protein n=1 Tax=Formosa sp. S-31 TaxID=2790949 RepID=UPI003EBC53CE
MKATRLYFIDAVRAFAILMMLQGHFIDGLLDPVYKSTDHLAFNIWNYFRGNTAPVFFTISGLIVMLLLLKAREKQTDKLRIKKSIKRGFNLILTGYLLRIPFFMWFSGHFNTYFLVTDVLQIIGLSLILLNGIYYLAKSNLYVLTGILTSIGTLIFLTEPYYRNLEVSRLPLAISNYLSKSNGSVFTIFPWFAYVCFGAVIAVAFHKFQDKPHFKLKTLSIFTASGLFLIFLSSPILSWMSQITGIDLFESIAVYNYLNLRLGNVLITFAVFFALESRLKHPLITRLGAHTLSVYVVHFIILYGSFIGTGLYRFLHHTLRPWPAVIGAALFMISVSVIVLLYEAKIKAFLKMSFRKAVIIFKFNTVRRLRLYRR